MTDVSKGFDLTSIAELKQCESDKDANEYLKLGWVLLSTHLTDYGHPVERHQKTVYCLGWQKSLGKPKHPKSEYAHLGGN